MLFNIVSLIMDDRVNRKEKNEIEAAKKMDFMLRTFNNMMGDEDDADYFIKSKGKVKNENDEDY